MLLGLHRLTLNSLDLDSLELSWQIDGAGEDILDWVFDVERSEAPGGPFLKVASGLVDTYFFVDQDIPTGHRYRHLFYRVVVTNIRDGRTETTEPVVREPEADLNALEIRRQMQLLFREFTGRRCWVLPVRTFGARCSCWDLSSNMPTRGFCSNCYMVGYIRGYHTPVEAWIEVQPNVKANQVTNLSNQQQSNTTARCGYYPRIKPGDVIVEAENRRWKVNSIVETELVRAPIFQNLQLHELAPKDIEFRIPLNLPKKLNEMELSPERNFKNPLNHEVGPTQEDYEKDAAWAMQVLARRY